MLPTPIWISILLLLSSGMHGIAYQYVTLCSQSLPTTPIFPYFPFQFSAVLLSHPPYSCCCCCLLLPTAAAAGLKAIYLSGWQVAGDANTAAQTYPDQSLYPADSVPKIVERINNAFMRADQIQHVQVSRPTVASLSSERIHRLCLLRHLCTLHYTTLHHIPSIGALYR